MLLTSNPPTGTWILATQLTGRPVTSDEPYPCLCWHNPRACSSTRCPCWGRLDVAVLWAACCARTWSPAAYRRAEAGYQAWRARQGAMRQAALAR